MKYAIQCENGLFAGCYIYQGEQYIEVEIKGYVKPKFYSSRKRAENALKKVIIIDRIHGYHFRGTPYIVEVEENEQ